jgi:hypothetical protein
MASQAPNHDSELPNAILQHVELGAYPEPDVASAEIPASALPGILEAVDKTREGVKVILILPLKPLCADVDNREIFATSVANPPPTSMDGSPKPSNYK